MSASEDGGERKEGRRRERGGGGGWRECTDKGGGEVRETEERYVWVPPSRSWPLDPHSSSYLMWHLCVCVCACVRAGGVVNIC